MHEVELIHEVEEEVEDVVVVEVHNSEIISATVVVEVVMVEDEEDPGQDHHLVEDQHDPEADQEIDQEEIDQNLKREEDPQIKEGRQKKDALNHHMIEDQLPKTEDLNLKKDLDHLPQIETDLQVAPDQDLDQVTVVETMKIKMVTNVMTKDLAMKTKQL